MKLCKVCNETLDDAAFDKYRVVCKKCEANRKKERAANKDKNAAPHVDACVKCSIAFDEKAFTWRVDVGAWRKTCRKCTTPASASVKYRQKKREQGEEKYKKANAEYMREYRAKKKKEAVSKEVMF